MAEEGFREGLLSIAHRNDLDPHIFLPEAYDITFNRGYVTGNIDEQTFWQTLREVTGIRGSDQELREEILSRFVLREWILRLVTQLKAASVSTAILSDQTNWLDELDGKYNFFRLFDEVFNSYHLGKSKKDPSLFVDILSEMDYKPEESLFIDDSQDNVSRAKQKGLYTIHYQDRETLMQTILTFFPFL